MSLLTIDDMTKRFGNITALNGLSITVEDDDIVGVIGPNGAGKTTLFNCISGFLTPDEGDILFRERNIDGTSPVTICRQGVARTFQESNALENHTCLQNVLVGLLFGHEMSYLEELLSMFTQTIDEELEDEAHDLLEMFGLEAKSQLNASALTLSERKRLGLARAYATDPDLLLIDEITAGLSGPETETIAEDILTVHGRDVTILVIEHDVEFIRQLTNRIVVLNYGEKIYDGDPEKLIEDEQVQEAYLGGA